MLAGMTREEAEAGTGFRFTNGKDATSVCIPQYRKAFVRLVGAAKMLLYFSCGWGDEEAAVVCDALLWAHENGATSPARYLNLSSNKLTDASVARLVELFSAGAVPKLGLGTLSLQWNELSDAGKRSVKAAGEARGLRVDVWG